MVLLVRIVYSRTVHFKIIQNTKHTNLYARLKYIYLHFAVSLWAPIFFLRLWRYTKIALTMCSINISPLILKIPLLELFNLLASTESPSLKRKYGSKIYYARGIKIWAYYHAYSITAHKVILRAGDSVTWALLQFMHFATLWLAGALFSYIKTS